MKKHIKKKKFPKDPHITSLENLRKDPGFQKLYRRAYLRLGIAIAIARLRHEKKISQKRLADILDTNQAVVSRIERGHENLSLDRLMRIAEALGAEARVDLVKKSTSPQTP